MVDENGYPTDEELDRIKHFHGTPREFVEYIDSIWVNGAGVQIEDGEEWGRPQKVITMITGGWSGCETTVGVIGKSSFSLFFHSLWRRGGLYEYRVPESQWEMEMHWGWFEFSPYREDKK